MSVDVKVVGGRFVTVYPPKQSNRVELTARKRGSHAKQREMIRYYYGDYMDDVKQAVFAQGD